MIKEIFGFKNNIFGILMGELAIAGIVLAAKAILSLGKKLDVVKEDENIEELGDKSVQAAKEGITPDKYEKFDDYLDEVENFETDPEISLEIPEEEKYARGAEIVAEAINEKYPESKEYVEIVAKNPEVFSEISDEINEVIAEEPSKMKDIAGYVDSTEKNISVNEETQSELLNVILQTHPGWTEKEALDYLSKLSANNQ